MGRPKRSRAANKKKGKQKKKKEIPEEITLSSDEEVEGSGNAEEEPREEEKSAGDEVVALTDEDDKIEEELEDSHISSDSSDDKAVNNGASKAGSSGVNAFKAGWVKVAGNWDSDGWMEELSRDPVRRRLVKKPSHPPGSERRRPIIQAQVVNQLTEEQYDLLSRDENDMLDYIKTHTCDNCFKWFPPKIPKCKEIHMRDCIVKLDPRMVKVVYADFRRWRAKNDEEILSDADLGTSSSDSDDADIVKEMKSKIKESDSDLSTPSESDENDEKDCTSCKELITKELKTTSYTGDKFQKDTRVPEQSEVPVYDVSVYCEFGHLVRFDTNKIEEGRDLFISGTASYIEGTKYELRGVGKLTGWYLNHDNDKYVMGVSTESQHYIVMSPSQEYEEIYKVLELELKLLEMSSAYLDDESNEDDFDLFKCFLDDGGLVEDLEASLKEHRDFLLKHLRHFYTGIKVLREGSNFLNTNIFHGLSSMVKKRKFVKKKKKKNIRDRLKEVQILEEGSSSSASVVPLEDVDDLLDGNSADDEDDEVKIWEPKKPDLVRLSSDEEEANIDQKNEETEAEQEAEQKSDSDREADMEASGADDDVVQLSSDEEANPADASYADNESNNTDQESNAGNESNAVNGCSTDVEASNDLVPEIESDPEPEEVVEITDDAKKVNTDLILEEVPRDDSDTSGHLDPDPEAAADHNNEEVGGVDSDDGVVFIPPRQKRVRNNRTTGAFKLERSDDKVKAEEATAPKPASGGCGVLFRIVNEVKTEKEIKEEQRRQQQEAQEEEVDVVTLDSDEDDEDTEHVEDDEPYEHDDEQADQQVDKTEPMSSDSDIECLN